MPEETDPFIQELIDHLTKPIAPCGMCGEGEGTGEHAEECPRRTRMISFWYDRDGNFRTD